MGGEWFRITQPQEVDGSANVIRGNMEINPRTTQNLWTYHRFCIKRFHANFMQTSKKDIGTTFI